MVRPGVTVPTGTINNALIDGAATCVVGGKWLLVGKRIRGHSDPGQPSRARVWPARVRLGACAAAVTLGSHIVAARAQVEATPILDQYLPPQTAGGGTDFQPGITVATRSRPEFQAPGVQFGTINLRPQLNESVGYDSNPAGLANGKGSPMVETQGSVTASMSLPVTTFRISANVDDVRYTALPRQSYTNWGFSAGAEHQFGLDDLIANYSHQMASILPSGLNTSGVQEPFAMSLDDGQISYRKQLGTGFITPAFEIDRFNFDNVLIPGTNFSQSLNDRIVLSPSVTFGYEFATRRTAVLVVRDSKASYTQNAPGMASRDYNDFAIMGGVDFDADAQFRFRALIGYEHRSFSSSQFSSIQAPIFEATAIWTPTGLTTVTATIARQIEAALDNTTTGFTENYGQIRVDHEFAPNVTMYGRAGYYYDQYQSIGNQSLISVGVGANWLLNREVQLGASYDFVSRMTGSTASATSFGPDYNDHRVLLNLQLRL